MAAWGTWLLRLAYAAGGVAGISVALLYFLQEKLLYVPRIPGVPEQYYWEAPDKYGLEYEDVTLTTADGVQIHAWMLKLPNWTVEYTRTRPVVLFFQENAGSMSFRLHFLKLMMWHLRCPVLAVSYRGYGYSKGKPNEKGLQRDADAGLQYLLTRDDVDTSRIVVFGRSLGGAVATYLTAKNQDKVKACVLENTFTAVEDMVSQIVPPLGLLIGDGKPCNFLVTNKWHTKTVLPKITKVPLLMFVSKKDEMVPAVQMYHLHKLQRAPYCPLVELPAAHHMDGYTQEPEIYWGAMKMFFQEHVEAGTST